MKGNFAGPPIMKGEIRASMRMKILDKAICPGNIPAKLLEALGDYVIDRIAALLNKICDTGQILPEISKFYLHFCLRKQEQQSVNGIELSVLWVVSPKYF